MADDKNQFNQFLLNSVGTEEGNESDTGKKIFITTSWQEHKAPYQSVNTAQEL